MTNAITSWSCPLTHSFIHPETSKIRPVHLSVPLTHPTSTHPRQSMRQVPTYESTQPLTSSQGNTPRSLGDHKVGGKQSHEEHPHMLSPPWGALHQFSPLILTAILYCAHSTEEKNWGTQEGGMYLRSSGWRVQRWKSDPSWVHTRRWLTTGEPLTEGQEGCWVGFQKPNIHTC